MIKINGVIINPTNFPDNTKLIKYQVDKFHRSCHIEWFYENDEEMFLLYCLTLHCQKAGADCTLFLPYIPNARMDRTKSEEEVFTLKYFAEFINSLYFTEVQVLDPHSYVSTALIDRVRVIDASRCITEAIIRSNPDVIFFPDEGAMKRYSDLITNDCGRVFGIKNRDWKTGEIKGLELYGEIDKLKGAKILIIDDICSKGGTFYHSAKALHEAGAAAIDLYVTHCENTIFKGELLKEDSLINRIYTTNSLRRESSDKIEVFEL